ncbi:antibiotic biosynthesis monooxygenase [Amycolatopsis suaedae]|uniref:Antibiotic biosynthesis monooxygenase n=1 Tax=Amycolatopsis suaedae TaxID=2510978 RepID=A0A4Q7J4P7_9PSEU|nr:antibiotic biosynthesis monooxygenase [Amycolatopsis suaedae]RZQ61997.1 antibiotic biosynthesis monooxygenase [Amycolatopsis suaedae]
MTNAQLTETLPDPGRADSGVVLASEWTVPADRQRAAADAALRAWDRHPLPDGLLSHSVYTSTDGERVLHYSQWTDTGAVARFRETDPARQREILAEVPEIERHGVDDYTLYRGGRTEGDTRVAGIIVLVTMIFDGPDPARQREWVDSVFAALDADRAGGTLPEGGIAAYFHTSNDGVKVINYAEWETEQHHIDALAAPGDGIGSPSPLWHRVQNFPGNVGGSVRRYHHVGTVSAAPAG